jgi:hypothetical protein
MNRDETIALFERCEAARAAAKKAALAEGRSADEARYIAYEAAGAVWNGEWAEPLLAEREAMEANGRWAAEQDWRGDLKPQNNETRVWMARAIADFNRMHFLVRGAEGTKVNAGEVKQDSAPEEPPLKTLSAEDNIDFSGFKFPGVADFVSATFSDAAWFESATFSGRADFARAAFSGDAEFVSATFSGVADFESTTFSGTVDFQSATFSDAAWFKSATFSGTASFESVAFSGDADFESATFSGPANFESAAFSGRANFRSATLFGPANFESATFSSPAHFDSATFSGDATFWSATFSGPALFWSTTFSGDAFFMSATFSGPAFLMSATFSGPADFNAIRGDRAFTLEDAHFEHVPDFIQAHFEEAPRLDNVTVKGNRLTPPDPDDFENPPPWHIQQHRAMQRRSYLYRRVTMADRDIPARWRALKRLAIQAHDQDREHDFFAREICSARFAGDWPVPWPVWKASVWLGFFRFWFGILYGLFSNYGRSVARPALWWILGVAVAAVFYLGEQPGMAWQRALAEHRGAVSPYATTTLEAWRQGRPCFEPRPRPTRFTSGEVSVIALSETLRAQTSAPSEALQLALRDGFLILYGDADTAHRTYGCLFGVELYGGGAPVAIVPPQIGLWSALHKLYSAIMIFLFGLALRNMLKMK